MPQRILPILPMLMAALAACGSVSPRFSPDISTALADHPMRRLETERLSLYYPAARREEALRVAARLEGCAGALHRRARIRDGQAGRKMVVIMPEMPFNNAYVAAPVGGSEPHSILSTYNTFDFTTELGLPSDPSYVGCHEIVHYVQFLQVDGFWDTVNDVFGDLISPQLGLDPWFLEGLATYYESRLQPGTGRMAWPAWRGTFHAGVAGRRLGGGDLSAFRRDAHWGNHYLVGSFFIEFLVERHGEDKLWELIDVQGHSAFWTMWVSLRFKYVYGKSLSALIDDFADWTAARFPVQPRPPAQRRVRHIGVNARYARSPGGMEAVIARDHDVPPRLSIYAPDGTLLRTHGLVDVVPPRMLTSGAPALVSGLSFTADGRQLYFTALDQGTTFEVARLVRYDVASGDMHVAHHGLGGLGGAISPDGTTYYFARADGDRMHLAALDLGTGRERILAQAPPRTYFLTPRPSPDGTRLVATVFSPEGGYEVRLFDARTGAALDRLPLAGRGGLDASFAGDHRLVLLAPHEGRFQVFAYDLRTRALARLSDAPYLAFAPRAQGDTVRFLDREGWGWNLAEIPLPAPQATTSAAPEAAPEATPETAGAAPGAVEVDPALAPPVSAAPRVLSDAPYSHLDHLLIPQVRTLAIVDSQDLSSPLFGLTLAGSDRLGFHNWGLSALYQANRGLWSGSFSYIDTQLAPLTIGIQASHFAFEIGEDERLQRQSAGELFLSRTMRDSTTLSLGATGVDDARPEDPVLERRSRRLAGPFLSARYSGAEGTPHGGLRRALRMSARAALYPTALSTLAEGFADLDGALGVTVPLPLWRRHALHLDLRGRDLVGLAPGTGLLQVGGQPALISLYRRSSDPAGPDYSNDLLPAGSYFAEPLRGFEDYALALDRVAIADATYRYPLIIDRGFASVLWLFPSLFFRQLDLELFGAVALAGISDIDQEDLHAAAGGALSLGLAVGLVPVSVRYQLARRLTDDLALVHDVGLGIGF